MWTEGRHILHSDPQATSKPNCAGTHVYRNATRLPVSVGIVPVI
jgi:hypothetical protein